MPPTQKGIYHNLKESVYTVSNGEIVFFFSSKFYRKKFLDGYKQHREQYLDRMSKLSPTEHLNMETLADITFYINTEKRGFLAWLKGVEITCEEIHLYALRKMISKNTQDWSEIQKPKLTERLKIMV